MKQLEFEFMKDIKPEYHCLYRVIRQCPNCTEDFDQPHHPNNYDCPRYYPILVSLGEAIIPNREIKDDLVRMLKEHSV